MQHQSSQKEEVEPLVVVIASDTHTIKLFSTGLQIVGYKVVGYQYRLDIVQAVKSLNPSIIIVDINNFVNSDFMLFKRLREDITQNCPIIVLVEKTDEQIFEEINANAYIIKPFNFNDVVVKVDTLIGHLNPQLSRPRKGYLFPLDNPPTDLPHDFHE